jgi:hypothetical protein
LIDRLLLRSLPFGTERPVIQLQAAAFKRVLIYLDLMRTETREQAAGSDWRFVRSFNHWQSICHASGDATGRERLCVWEIRW